MYTVRKHYGQELGLSCCFRQHLAKSHCKMLHGYALQFTFEFGCSQLDECGWVIDFGSLGWIKDFLMETFDHKLLVSEADPEIVKIISLNIADVKVIPATGCEAFAKIVFDHVSQELVASQKSRVWLISCTCSEHSGNSATYKP